MARRTINLGDLISMKDKLANYASILLIQLFTVSAIGLFFLAHRILTEGYGLNPFIALPAGTLFAILPYMTHRLLFAEPLTEEEEAVLAHTEFIENGGVS
jgi:hypothetical protein